MRRCGPGTPRRSEPDELRELLGAYVLGHLEGADLDRIEAALPNDRGLREEADRLATVAAMLELTDVEDLAPAETTPPPGLDDAVLAELRGTAGSRRAAPPGVPRRLPGGVRVAGPLVAGVVGIAIGWGVLVGGGDDPPPGLGVVEPIEVAVAASGLEVDARVEPHTWGSEVFLDMVGLEDGEVYQLDLLSRGGHRVSAGTFLGDADLEVVCVMNGALLREDVAAIVVTTEDGAEVIRSELERVPYRSV